MDLKHYQLLEEIPGSAELAGKGSLAEGVVDLLPPALLLFTGLALPKLSTDLRLA